FARSLFQRAVLHLQHRNSFTEQWHKMLRSPLGARDLDVFVILSRNSASVKPECGGSICRDAVSVPGFTGWRRARLVASRPARGAVALGATRHGAGDAAGPIRSSPTR